LPGSTSDETWIVGQRDGESPIEVARRVLLIVERAEATRDHIAGAAIFVSARLDDESMTARHVMARALLRGRLSFGETTELMMFVSDGADEDLREAIITLVDFLAATADPRSAPIGIHVDRLDDPSRPPLRKSGFHPRADRLPSRERRKAQALALGFAPAAALAFATRARTGPGRTR